jgi:glycosyltransferase involved in cell wall biosynthesis
MQHAYLANGRRLGRVQRLRGPELPIGVVGFHSSVLGIGEGARQFANTSRMAGYPTGVIDVSDLFNLNQDLSSPQSMSDEPGTLFIHLNPVELTYMMGRMGRSFPRQAFRAAFWAWETTRAPSDWVAAEPLVDAIFCPSSFTASAISQTMTGASPVFVLPHIVKLPEKLPSRKQVFGLDPHKVTLLCTYDPRSSLDRKNPIGAIEAFVRSGCGESGAAELVVKSHGSSTTKHERGELEAAIRGKRGIILMDRTLAPEDLSSLFASIDILVSAHRAEGFGLTLAEAMAAGKLVIATGWSGNMDFMSKDCAALVNYNIVPAKDRAGVYNVGSWAEPNLEHMAMLIREFVLQSEKRRLVGEMGRLHVSAVLSVSAWKSRLDSALDWKDVTRDPAH